MSDEFDDPEISNGDEAQEQPAEVFDLPHVIELSRPIKVSEKITRTEITFKKELDVGMLKHLPLDGAAGMLKYGHCLPIISAMTGEPSAVIEKLSRKDFQKCMDVVNSFL